MPPRGGRPPAHLEGGGGVEGLVSSVNVHRWQPGGEWHEQPGPSCACCLTLRLEPVFATLPAATRNRNWPSQAELLEAYPSHSHSALLDR